MKKLKKAARILLAIIAYFPPILPFILFYSLILHGKMQDKWHSQMVEGIK